MKTTAELIKLVENGEFFSVLKREYLINGCFVYAELCLQGFVNECH